MFWPRKKSPGLLAEDFLFLCGRDAIDLGDRRVGELLHLGFMALALVLAELEHFTHGLNHAQLNAAVILLLQECYEEAGNDSSIDLELALGLLFLDLLDKLLGLNAYFIVLFTQLIYERLLLLELFESSALLKSYLVRVSFSLCRLHG